MAALVGLQKQPQRNSAEAEGIARNIAGEREDIYGTIVDIVAHLGDASRVYVGQEPAGEAEALKMVSPAARRIYNEVKEARRDVLSFSQVTAASETSTKVKLELKPKVDASGSAQMPPPALKKSPSSGHRRSLSSGSGGSSGVPRKKWMSAPNPMTTSSAPKRGRDVPCPVIQDAFLAHRDYEKRGKGRPSEKVEGIISTSRYRNLTKAAYEAFECLVDGNYYGERDTLPRLTSKDLDSFPDCAVFITEMKDEMWSSSPLRRGEAVWIFRRWWYVFDEVSRTFIFDPDHRHLPSSLRQSARHRASPRSGYRR